MTDGLPRPHRATRGWVPSVARPRGMTLAARAGRHWQGAMGGRPSWAWAAVVAGKFRDGGAHIHALGDGKRGRRRSGGHGEIGQPPRNNKAERRKVAGTSAIRQATGGRPTRSGPDRLLEVTRNEAGLGKSGPPTIQTAAACWPDATRIHRPPAADQRLGRRFPPWPCSMPGWPPGAMKAVPLLARCGGLSAASVPRRPAAIHRGFSSMSQQGRILHRRRWQRAPKRGRGRSNPIGQDPQRTSSRRRTGPPTSPGPACRHAIWPTSAPT